MANTSNTKLINKVKKLNFKVERLPDGSGSFAYATILPKMFGEITIEVESAKLSEPFVKEATRFRMWFVSSTKTLSVNMPKTVNTFEKAVAFADKYFKEKLASKILEAIIKM